MINKPWWHIIWSNGTKTDLCKKNSKNYVSQTPGNTHHLVTTPHTVRHNGGSIFLWGCFSAAGIDTPQNWVKDEWSQIQRSPWRNPAVQTTWDWSIGSTVNTTMTQTAETKLVWLWDRSLTGLELPSQSPDLNPMEPHRTFLDFYRFKKKTKKQLLSHYRLLNLNCWAKMEICQFLIISTTQ